ncbi:MAG TPA: sulfotransferase [Rhodanobacteraceae bacterium]|nr:sulfotransferase [Rhodanobacteraceae bacterium]
MQQPSSSDFSPQQAARAYEQGRIAEAERIAGEVLARAYSEPLARNVLGLCLLARGRGREAIEQFAELTRQHPGEPLYWNNLGIALRDSGRYQHAQQAYETAVRLQPDNPRFLVNLAYLFVELKRVVRAKELLWRVFQLDPSNYEARIYGAQMCLECGEETNAKQILADWSSWAGHLSGILRVELAAVLLRTGLEAEGEALLRSQLDDPASRDAARARLILVLERLNKMEEARDLLAQLPPPDAVHDVILRGELIEANAVMAAREGNAGEARALLQQLLGQPDSNRRYVDTCFLLAKLCDKQGDYAACMQYLQRAHQAQLDIAAQLVPELMQPSANPLNIANFYVTPEQYATWKPAAAPSATESPIFVLGFPRSGTTMLEQMLDAHPGMASMDERPFVQRAIECMQAMRFQYPEQLGELDSVQCAMLRDVYWKAVAEVVQLQPGQRLVDKNPLTMLRLPLLVRLFPNARIIFVARHPCDVVLSNYMQHFNAPAYIALCSTLPRLAAGYAAAMKFWFAHVELLKPNVFEWRYEHVIEDFDANVERLAAFLQLENDAPLREFSEHARRKGYIGTPSYAQVVQPLYASSIGRWKRYREYFEPVLPLLEPAMRHWGYES